MQSWAINTQTYETNLGLLQCNKVFSGSIIPPPITMNTNKFTKHKKIDTGKMKMYKKPLRDECVRSWGQTHISRYYY